jgi:hypothetical protein|tara:strand:- start:4984 stop:5244 length:261 start_codon:yes stop_codon:yes gene_type:complete
MEEDKYKIMRVGKELYKLPEADEDFKDMPPVPKAIFDQLVQAKRFPMPPYYICQKEYQKNHFYWLFKQRLNYIVQQEKKGLPIDDT